MRRTACLATAVALLAALVGCSFADTASNQCVDITGAQCGGLIEQACIDLSNDGTCADEYYTVGSQTFHCASCDDRTSCSQQATAACSAMSPGNAGSSGTPSTSGSPPGSYCVSDSDCASDYCDTSTGICH